MIPARITVAAVVSHEERFLLVREQSDQQMVINQPAGHLELGEDLVSAVIRETLEETAWHIQPTHLLGIYRWTNPVSELTYLRFAFVAERLYHVPEQPLDQGIIEALWLNLAEVEAARAIWRSPMVMRCITDYLAGKRYPLTLLNEL